MASRVRRAPRLAQRSSLNALHVVPNSPMTADATPPPELAAARRRLAELEDTESQYRMLVEQLPLAVYRDLPDESATSEYISPQVEAIFGYPRDAWMDPAFFAAVLHPDDRERTIGATAAALARGDDRWSMEYRVIAADGRTVWVRDDAWIVKDGDGRATRVQGVMIDVTDQAVAHAEIRRQKQYFESLVEISPVAVVVMSSNTAPVAPMATGTPMPSTTAWTARRSSIGTT